MSPNEGETAVNPEEEFDGEVCKKPAAKTGAKAKATPKSAPKSKSTPKAKATAKAKAKTSAKKDEKKNKDTSSATKNNGTKGKGTGKSGQMKRPAAATVQSQVDFLKNGISDDEGSEDAKRDKGKAVKFKKRRDSLPPHIRDLIENQAQHKASPRAFRSLVINKL